MCLKYVLQLSTQHRINAFHYFQAIASTGNPLSKVALFGDVKSTAVVKYATLDMPAQFQQLRPYTNLNEAPANWLQGHSKWESFLRDISFGKEHSFSRYIHIVIKCVMM